MNEFARVKLQQKKKQHFIGVDALFNLPHPNTLQRYSKDDKSGIHLHKGGKTDLLNWIKDNIHQQTLEETQKRQRSPGSTPQSSEKQIKSIRTC